MKIIELITLAENKLMSFNQSMTTAVKEGNTEAIMFLEQKIEETQETLDRLRNIV